METYEAIMTRRMQPRCSNEVPRRDQIVKLLEAAVRAPTHHITQPWRFVVLAGEALAGLGDAWAEGTRRTGGDPESARAKPLRAPVIITVIEIPKTHLPKVVELEEHHSTGAAMQNILLAAHDMGLAATLRTGDATTLSEVRDYLGVADGEIVAGFVYLGYPAGDAPERPVTRRRPAEEVTQWRGFEEQ